MTKQIRDYVLEGRLIRESKGQKNETKDYKVGDFVKADFNWRGVHAKPVEGKIIEKRKALAGGSDPQPGFEYLVKAKDGNSYWVHQYGILESSQKNEGFGPYSEVEKQLEKFKKYMYQNYKNHPGFDRERKEAIETVLDLLRELNEG